MEELLQVVYVGADASETAERWADGDRPFEVTGIAPADGPATIRDLDRLDGVVCLDEGDVDVLAVAEAATERSAHLPVVVLSGSDGIDAATALDYDVSHVLPVDEATDVVELLASVGPVVERHRAQRRELSMLDSLLENIPLSVYFKDRQSRHRRVSDATTSMIGPDYLEAPDGKRYHAAEDLLGTTDFDLYTADLAESAVEDDRTVVERETQVVDRIEHSEGYPTDRTFVATSKAPWYDQYGDVVGVVGVTRDISERKQYEQELERQNERLERFAHVVSHDLRNPLEVAMGHLDFARESGDAASFEAIERGLRRMDAIIDDVLTMAREGESVSEPSVVDAATVARNAWSLIDSGSSELVLDTDVTVLADPDRLARLFGNLYRNSLEHGRTDETDRLTVTVGDIEGERGFYVADDGVGIPEAERETVFDTGYSTSDEGTGLGLDIVRTIADAHGWDVSVTESEAGGARFEFRGVHGP